MMESLKSVTTVEVCNKLIEMHLVTLGAARKKLASRLARRALYEDPENSVMSELSEIERQIPALEENIKELPEGLLKAAHEERVAALVLRKKILQGRTNAYTNRLRDKLQKEIFGLELQVPQYEEMLEELLQKLKELNAQAENSM